MNNIILNCDNLNIQRQLTISEAQDIDHYLFEVCGQFWRAAYNFPKEGDIISDTEEGKTYATNVGIFTFDITDEEPLNEEQHTG
jgi:hypothetical protein